MCRRKRIRSQVVTIGVKKVGDPGGQPKHNMVLGAGWPGFGPSKLAFDLGGVIWFVTAFAPQGDPFDPIANSSGGNGQVLIAQFSHTLGSTSGASEAQTRLAIAALQRFDDAESALLGGV